MSAPNPTNGGKCPSNTSGAPSEWLGTRSVVPVHSLGTPHVTGRGCWWQATVPHPHPQPLKNSPLEVLGWFKDDLCIYSGGCISSVGESRHSWNLEFYLSWIWHWRSRSTVPQNSKDLRADVFCTSGGSGPIVAILAAWRGDQLSRGQTCDWYIHTHTDGGNDNTRRPKPASGKNQGWF